jgi:hypothetical protein
MKKIILADHGQGTRNELNFPDTKKHIIQLINAGLGEDAVVLNISKYIVYSVECRIKLIEWAKNEFKNNSRITNYV